MSAGSLQRLPLLLAGVALWVAGSSVVFASGSAASNTTAATPLHAQPAAGSATTVTATATATADGQSAADGVTLAHARWEYKGAAFFKRVSEYFSRKENTGYRLTLRTDAKQRGGLYFQALLSKPAAQLPQGSSALVTYFTADSQAAISHRFPLPDQGAEAEKTQLWLGFTGEGDAQTTTADATSPAQPKPTAWEIRIEDAEGKTLASAQSFLWHPLAK